MLKPNRRRKRAGKLAPGGFDVNRNNPGTVPRHDYARVAREDDRDEGTGDTSRGAESALARIEAR